MTVYPVFTGPIDLSRGFDPEKNGVRIRMRLLNEIDVDITDWEFRDVTPGRTPFTLDSASTGELVNTVKVGDPIHVNGRPFPSHDTLRVDWAVEGTDKSGTIPAEKFTSDATLITIAADALAELASAEYNGKTIVFTVRGNFSSAKISATLKYVAPPVPGPVVTDTHSDQEAPGESCKVTVTGSNLRFADGADPAEKVFFRDGDEGEEEKVAAEDYLETPEFNDDGTELAFRLVSGQWGPGDHTIHLRLGMVDAEGNPVSVDAGTFGFSGV